MVGTAEEKIVSLQKSIQSSTADNVTQLDDVSQRQTSNDNHLLQYTDELNNSLSSRSEELSHLLHSDIHKDKPSGMI